VVSFTEEDFIKQVKKSRSWGGPTTELLEMMEEMIIDEARKVGGDCIDKTYMVESSLADFESNDLLINMVNNVYLETGNIIENFRSSICCTFKHYNRKSNE